MPLTVTQISELRAYIDGVIGRAEHHAGSVDGIALALVGAILWRMDDDNSIKVLMRDGETKNVLWVTIGGTRYAFSYNHAAEQIELRRESVQGPTLHVFSNATPLSDLRGIFAGL